VSLLRDSKTVLTFFAHPDDETLASGATLCKLSEQGATIHAAIPNTGIHARKNNMSLHDCENNLTALRADCSNALQLLGIDHHHIYLGDFADNEIDRYTLLELIHWFENILVKIKPDLILTHHRYCTNIDHQYCHEAAVIATRPSLHCHIPILCSEVPSSTGYLKPTQWEPNFFVEINKEQLQRKVKAMTSYQGETRADPHPRSPEVLKALAKVRGSESGFFYAEAFMIQKQFS